MTPKSPRGSMSKSHSPKRSDAADGYAIITAESELKMTQYPVAAYWPQTGAISFPTARSSDILVDYTLKSEKVNKKLSFDEDEDEDDEHEKEEVELEQAESEIDQIFPVLPDKAPSILTCRIQHHTFTGDNSPTMAHGYMLGVMDRITREVRLVPFADVFPRMAWSAPPGSSDRDTVTPPRDSSSSSMLTTPSSSGTPRMSTFSSAPKKRKRNDQKNESFSVEMSGDAAAMLAFTENDAHVDMDALMMQPKDADINLKIGEEIRPHPNLEAKTPKELYDWEKILPPDDIVAAFFGTVLDELQEATVAIVAQWKKSNRFALCFTSFMDKMIRSKKQEEGAMKIVLMLFVNYLCHMLDHRDKPMKKDAILPAGVPEAAAKYFIEEFTDQHELSAAKRVVTERNKNKIIARILLLILHVEQYAADISTFILPLGTKERKKIASIATIIGAGYSEKNTKGKWSYAIVLKKPWNFPKVSTGNTPQKKKKRGF
ncbi:hypothetical protein BV898_04334 [Hypsibius exemplaris]|uniref:DNA-directed RNA polymerase I subunit RPA49 n=1 Tax=Hypsibius exemplaris TaxID=2072580 RepID=A0A1W0X2L1_HYPEX|nr:hypothetical protein BV898_04334 [Hypsibius exemplaris]